MSRPGFVVAAPVAAAVAEGRPVVALETTLVTHGLPGPHGLRVAEAIEAVVRSEGALPATIGILAGGLRVGLRADELKQLATANAVKVNPGNLAAVVAAGMTGSTTVAATLVAAARAGIRMLATGGIGGVHRGATESGDVSADLVALARQPVAVVCAGAKAILDLPRTREMLETLGVPVLGLGCNEFPAFYRRSSGLAVDARCDTPDQAAAAIAAHVTLGMPGGLVVANPIPVEHELPVDIYEPALATAVADAAAAGVRGRAVTPFLLERMRTLTGDASLRANEALLLHNARLAARIAVALAHDPTLPRIAPS
ncbi:MAG: pseudouridine-5'-phosphate glycosidase [Planctomycetes bacterium]|nr:pseudouridine-5'-phosphate glycosidase [Planctomycetota bacterium]MBM4058127.1 pseudouridine-5'-phosphate glycosidase [Planctomycetota bacterium]